MPEPKKSQIKVDFTGVESGGGAGAHIPEGDYGFKVSKVMYKKKEEEPGGPGYLSFIMEVIKGNPAALKKKIYHTCSLKKNSLWNLRNLLEACGKQVPSKAVNLSLEGLKNLECAGTVVDDEYKGKKKSVISAFFPMGDLFVANADKKEKDDVEEGDEEEAEEGEAEEGEGETEAEEEEPF